MKKILIIASLFLVVGCSYFKKEDKNSEVIAKIGNEVLYRSEIEKLLPPNYTLEDSTSISTNYVTSWALHRLLMEKAEENLSKESKEHLDELIEQYKIDLYTEYYMDRLADKGIDATVTNKQIEDFYKSNGGNFKSGEDLVKLRYVQVTEQGLKSKSVERFKRFNSQDKKALMEGKTDFYTSFLNDTVWVGASSVYSKMPFLQGNLRNDYYQHKDTTGLYSLVKIEALIHGDSEAPLEYIKPTIRQIIINKRKQEYTKQLEKEIIEKAIERKQLNI